MKRRAIFITLGVMLSVVIFSGCTTNVRENSENSISPSNSGMETMLTSRALEDQENLISAATDLARSIIADIQSGIEPVQGEENSGQSVLEAYRLFTNLNTVTNSDPVLVQTPSNPKEDYYIFTCDVSGESVTSSRQFEDKINLYIKINPTTHEVIEKNWYSDHVSAVYFSNETLKRFFDCAVKNDPMAYSQMDREGGGEPSQEQINYYQKNMTYYTQKYALSSYTIMPAGISQDNSFFIKYEVTDAKGTVFEINTGKSDGMVYPLLPQ